MRYIPHVNTPPRINQLRALGYKTFEDKDFDLNIVGIRSRNRRADAFDDHLCVYYKEGGLWVEERYNCTVDAGAYWMQNPYKEEGCAILKAGQYRGVWSIDLHRGKYEALCQKDNAPVTVWRDANKDLIQDKRTSETGYFGINCHRALEYKIARQVGRFSAGCTVIQHPADFARLLVLCRMQIAAGLGDKFTYTLIED